MKEKKENKYTVKTCILHLNTLAYSCFFINLCYSPSLNKFENTGLLGRGVFMHPCLTLEVSRRVRKFEALSTINSWDLQET
jgi:hypothetical protein